MLKLGKVIKKRPRIRLRVPREITPGKTFTADIRLHAKREVEVEYVDVVLVGTEGWSYGENGAAHEVCRLGVRASDKLTLAKGNNELQVRCTIPQGSPSSYAGKAAYVRYRMDVHVHLSWWPDSRSSFEIVVRDDAHTKGEGVPRIYTTNTAGPKGTEPHVEVSIATDAVEPGGEVLGNITLYNVQHNPYRDVMLSLVARERLLRGAGISVGHADTRFVSRIAIDPRYDGETHPFRLKVPEQAMPARRHRMWRLEWLFEVEARARKSALLRFPIRMLSEVTVSDERLWLAAPTIGQKRVATHWSAIAQRRGFVFANMALKQTRDALEIEVLREHRGEDGTFLVARFTYPSLGLDLEGGPRRGLRHVMRGVDLGTDDFAKKHYVKGREDAQVLDLWWLVASSMSRFRMEHLDDTRLELAREGSGHSEQALDHFVLDVLNVANAWEKMRRDLIAPKAMRGARASWAQLARHIDGRFDAGDMSVHGKLDGAPADVATQWKGDAVQSTRFTLRPNDLIEPELRFECTPEEWAWGSREQLSGEARALVESILKVVTWLRVDEDVLELEFAGPLLDGGEVLKHLRSLAALAALLRTHAGPYR